MRAACIYAWIGGRWVDADKGTDWQGYIPVKHSVTNEQDATIPMIATGIALRQRYEWSVSLGLEDSPSVRFATDPTGIKDVFRIRDLPEGRDRREALLTWVGEHWRQDRTDPDLETFVRKHLRGATSFSWLGMTCELVPSQFDIERRNSGIAQRDEMRRAGNDKRQKGGS